MPDPLIDPLFEQLQQRAELCGVKLNSSQLADINTYCTALTEYNQNVNLISRTDLDFLLFDHVLDSLSLIPLIENLSRQNGKPHDKLLSLADIGSGAGFPALILAVICPELRVSLIEATAKKCIFLNEAIAALNLSNRVHVLNSRAEDLGHDLKHRGKFQFVTARAVGSLELITELAMPLLLKDGYLLAQKSQAQVESELASGVSVFGASVQKVEVLNKEALGKERVVLIIKKSAATPKQFPRPFTKIAKHKL